MGNCTACSVLLTSETCGKMEENSPLCTYLRHSSLSFRGCTLLDASEAYFEMEGFLLEVQKPRLWGGVMIMLVLFLPLLAK